MQKFDYLVIGGGIAGLRFALDAAKSGTVALVSKRDFHQGSSWWAQGGIAAVHTEDDSADLHAQDTLVAGAGLCNPHIVDIVVREGPDRVSELIALGTNFDKEGSASSENDSAPADFHLHKEGGHSRRRIFHHGDATGAEIQRTLLRATQEEKNICFFENATVVELITRHRLEKKVGSISPNEALGAYILLENGTVEVFLSPNVIVATGGAGKVYLYTSNPDVSTGDGIALAYRAGCRVANMEFFQFHPTCLYHPKAKTFLITEALRGEGAILRRMTGEEFMGRYDLRKELAPRDIVARAIDHEMKLTGQDYVLLDITHKSREFLSTHFPTIYEHCKSFGIDMATDMIPVVPAAHYLCGGVAVNEWGQTDIDGLYAIGECACTGLHGANRLASNSLLEGLVFAVRAATKAKERLQATKGLNKNVSESDMLVPAWDTGSATESDERVVITQNWDEIRRFMWNYVGIVRTTKRLERALSRSQHIRKEIHEYYWNNTVTRDLLELRNLSLVAELVIRSALNRKESRGLHYTLDFPNLAESANDTILNPH